MTRLQREYAHLPGKRMVFIDQNTEPWFEARTTCRFTASAVPGMMGFGYNPWRVCWGELTGQRVRPPANAFLQRLLDRGHEKEEECKEWLRAAPWDWTIYEGGFWWCPTEPSWGASPDGLVALEDGTLALLEVKAPKFVESAAIGTDKYIAYRIQIEFQMMCTGLDHAVLVVFSSPDEYAMHELGSSPELRFLIRTRLRHLSNALDRRFEPDPPSPHDRLRARAICAAQDPTPPPNPRLCCPRAPSTPASPDSAESTCTAPTPATAPSPTQ